jgi:copper chaperone CopZ
VLGRRALGLFLLTIAVGAFASGLLLDALLPWLGRAMPGLEAMPPHHEHASVWSQFAAIALTAIVAHAWWRARRPQPAGQRGAAPSAAAPAASTRTFAVEGMHCSHCVQSVSRAIGELAGVVGCQVDLEAGRARVTGTGLDSAAVIAAVEALGFRARALAD